MDYSQQSGYFVYGSETMTVLLDEQQEREAAFLTVTLQDYLGLQP